MGRPLILDRAEKVQRKQVKFRYQRIPEVLAENYPFQHADFPDYEENCSIPPDTIRYDSNTPNKGLVLTGWHKRSRFSICSSSTLRTKIILKRAN
jgi:hypothetical protein